MNKLLKKVLTLCVAICTVIGFASCNGGNGQESSSSNTGISSESSDNGSVDDNSSDDNSSDDNSSDDNSSDDNSSDDNSSDDNSSDSDNGYTVTWKNEDGTILETDTELLAGTMPEYNGETPVKAATAQYTYTFLGWDKEVVAVNGNVTYTAKYSATINKYTITFIVDGVTTTQEVEYGTTPVFEGTTDKTADAQYTYTFAGWDSEIVAVTGEATYTATYTSVVKKYTITFVVDGVTTTQEVEYGTMPVFEGTTDKATDGQYTYTFAGWDNEIVAVTGEATYTATYTSVEILDWQIAEYDDEVIIGNEISIPTAAIVGKATGNEVTEGITVSAMFNEETVDITSGKFMASVAGTLVLTYAKEGVENKAITITFIDSIILVDTANVISKIVSADCTVGQAQVGNVTGAALASAAAYAIKLPGDSTHAGYSGVASTIIINVGDVSAYDYLEFNFWAIGAQGDTWTLSVADKTASGTGWEHSYDAPVTIKVPVSAVVDGKLIVTFQQNWGEGDELYIQYIKGVFEATIKAETPEYLLLGSNVKAEDYIAKYTIGETVIEENIKVASATFNGEAIELPYAATATGTLTLTYEYMGATKSFDIEIVDEMSLVMKENLISKTTYVSGDATIGNVSDAMFAAESSYCIKLPADYANYSVTIDVEVGDVSKFTYLELKFWALGIQGDTWTVDVGGKSVSGTGWANDYNNPVILQLPVSAVVNGKLRITFSETWAIADEFYIQHIKGFVQGEIEVETPEYLLVGSNVKAEDYIAKYAIGETVVEGNIKIASATFNGEAIELPYVATATGTLTLTYEYNGVTKSFDIEVVDEVTLVTKENLISKTTHVSGAATIGNVSDAMFGAESSYCIKLPADYANYSVTIDVEVGDVSKFSYVEIKFWALGIQGDTWTVDVGGTTVSGTGWANDYNNPVILQVPASAVVNGKLRITFTETWAIADEFYIQYIKGVAALD